MGKVRYREPSENYEKSSLKKEKSNIRVSIGKEQSIGEYYFISVADLLPYKNQARRLFKDEEIKELADTIKEHGIKTPLLVIPSNETQGKFEVISGERRLRAAKFLGLEKVPCIITDESHAEEVALIDNIQRSELHPVELGDGLKSLLSHAGWGDISNLANKLGKSQSTISHYLSYSKIPDSIKSYLIKNDIRSREVLRKLLKCENQDEMEELLGIKEFPKKNHAPKSILRINLSLDKFNIQDSNLFKIDKVQREEIKKILVEIVKKIENFDN